MFYIHGGSRIYGSAAGIPPEGIVKNYANEVVTLLMLSNTRLGKEHCSGYNSVQTRNSRLVKLARRAGY